MKRFSFLVLFVLLAGAVSAERTVAPPSSSAALLSFTITPNATIPFGRDGSLGNLATSLPFGGPNPGGTISCLYQPRSSPLFIGVDLGYLYMTLYDMGENLSGSLSMVQAGLSAGVHLNILPTVGLRLFGSGGYSYNLVQPRVSDDRLYNLFHLNNSTAGGGTPFVGAGAELFWTFIPSFSLTAGARYLRYVDLYDGLALTLGVSYDLPVGPRPAKPSTQRAVPLKKAPNPRPESGSEVRTIGKLSQFLTPGEEAVQSFSTQITSCVEPNMNHAIDKNLQSAIGLHEALRLLGIAYVSSPSESTASMSVKLSMQTLQDRCGNCCDLSVLYISLLASIQVETAFITVPGHVYIAFALASGQEEEWKMCSYSDELLFREGKAWVPVEVMERQGSLFAAWKAGLQEWRKARKQARLYPVRAAGNTHEPTGSAESGSQPPLTDMVQVAQSFQEEVGHLVVREIHDREARLTDAVSSSNRSSKSLNALGLLYARYELLEKAESSFLAAVETHEYAPALVNLGNLRLCGRRAEEALGFYQRAAAVAPDDPAVLLGLARSNFQLRNFVLAGEQYRELQMRDLRLAEQFSYISLRGEWARQEAEADRMKDVMVWGEEK
ncbi:MAG: hypothetical protein ABSG17_02690 [Spirochaetia bacterium]|jgi:tetratricopeptide (TPR) repeat protein